VSLGKINTIDKFRQYKNNTGYQSKNFSSIRKTKITKNSKSKIKDNKKTKKKKKKTKKKILKKKVEIVPEIIEDNFENINKIKDKNLNLSEYFSSKNKYKDLFEKFDDGKAIIKYLFEDSKDVSDQEMFHFLLLTNKFYNTHLNK